MNAFEYEIRYIVAEDEQDSTRILNEMGLLGWEFCCISHKETININGDPHHGDTSLQVIFKRKL